MKKKNENGGKDPTRDAIEKLSDILVQFEEMYEKAATALYREGADDEGYREGADDEEAGRCRILAIAAEMLFKALRAAFDEGSGVLITYGDEPEDTEALFADGRSGVIATLSAEGTLRLHLEPDYAGIAADVRRLKAKAEAGKCIT